MMTGNDMSEETSKTTRLEQIQQWLLAHRYSYLDGDLSTWPRGPVIMGKGESSIVILPYDDMSSEQLNGWMQLMRESRGDSTGFLVIGSATVDDPAIDALFAQRPPALVYVHSDSGQFRSYRNIFRISGSPPRALTESNLPKLLSPPEPRVLKIDCRAELQRDLESRQKIAEFDTKVSNASEVKTPFITYGIILICIAVHVLAQWVSSEALFDRAALKGPQVRSGEYWRLITYSLLHGSLAHLWFNALALFMFGKELELIQGRWRLGLCYLFSVVTASLASVWWNPVVTSVGASGGVFGLIGMQVAQLLRFRREFPEKLWRGIGMSMIATLAINVLLLMVPFIDGAAHVGGFLGGFFLMLALNHSPTQPSAPARWQWVTAGILLVFAVAFGVHALRPQ